jgi:hypothetical protein
MKKEVDAEFADDMLPEYDFSGARRGEVYRSLSGGYTIREEHPDGSVTITRVDPSDDAIVLEPDVKAYFPDSESVNRALRTIITLFPQRDAGKRKTTTAGTQGRRRAASSRGRSV